MPHRILYTPDDVDQVCRLLASHQLPLTVQWTRGKDRSLDQNALQWLWAGEVARQLEGQTADDIQARWKLHHGVPILRSEDVGFCAFYDRCIKNRLTYEEKIDAMRFTPVTSIMKVGQMSRYLETVLRECQDQGLQLTIPREGL